MKKVITLVTLFTIALGAAGLASAGPFGGGCCNAPQQAQSDSYRKFQQDTLDLRQEMMAKRFEIQRENLKATPDTAKIDSLWKEVAGLQAKIQVARQQYGLPDRGKRDGECGPMGGCGNRMGGCGGKPCYVQ